MDSRRKNGATSASSRRNRPPEVHRTLVEHYGYSLDQMDQGSALLATAVRAPTSSSGSPLMIAPPKRFPVLVVECKTDGIEIQEKDYKPLPLPWPRSENLCRHQPAPHCCFQLVATPGEFVAINEIPKATDWGDARRLKEVLDSLRLQSQGISGSAVCLPQYFARCPQDGPGPRLRYHLEDSFHQDVRRAFRTARHFHDRLSGQTRPSAAAHRSGGA